MTDEIDILHPRAAERLYGHQEAAKMLGDQLASGRPHHGWLLTGPRGIGKSTFAYTVAKSILSGAAFDPPANMFGETDPLDFPRDHPIVGQVAQGAAASLFVYERRVDPRSGKLRTQIDVELVRQNGARFHLHTADGGWRIAIVDCLNDLNPSSANALLKLLEEPPSKSLFLLINHTGGFVLPTLRSRCLTLTMNPLSEDDLAAVIAQTDDIAPDVLPLVHRLAAGSAGRALEMTTADGPGLYRQMIGLLSGLPDRDDEKLHKLATKLGRNRESPEYQTFVALLEDWLAKTARLAASQAAAEDQAFIPEEVDVLNRFIVMPGVDRWVGVWEKIVDLFRRTEIRNLDRKQTLLDAFYCLQQAVRA